MNELARSSSSNLLPVAPRLAVATRLATVADLAFLDGLQKQHNKALGFFPRAQMEGYVRNGWVLIAEDAATGTPLGYCASRDRYLKRDELGVVYQLCIAPSAQRGLIGASLIKAVFERSAYGCRLYCCWCAQDLAANYFWESMGFVPIAFRAGSTGKRRVHIFWQRRIVDGDATPWWYPSKTESGAIREDRLVFPIPPGTDWKDVKPIDLPRAETPQLEATRAVKAKPKARPIPRRANVPMGGFRFQTDPPPAQPKPRAPKEARAKIDPRLVSAARELRDRYLERVNQNLLPASPAGKYDVSRALRPSAAQNPLLPAA